MEASDVGQPITLSQPSSAQAIAFGNVAKAVAGRISVIAAEIRAAERAETEAPSTEDRLVRPQAGPTTTT